MKKWIICSWRHRGWLCFDVTRPNDWRKWFHKWHCIECRPCNVEVLKYLNEQEKD